MDENDKPLVWLHGEIKTPPFSLEARLEVGVLLRCLQQGQNLGMPHSRPMPSKEYTVMNYECGMQIKTGELFTELMRMQF